MKSGALLAKGLHKHNHFQSRSKPLRPGAEQLTVEAAVGHVELLEVRECAPFRRNSTSKLVRSFAKIRIATLQNENLKRSWKHLWQRTCANKTPHSVATIKPLSTDAERTCQRAVREVEFCDVVAKLANIQWECKALIVAESESWNGAFRLHANNLEGQLAFAHTPIAQSQ